MEYVRELRDFGVGADEIGIITPYRRQVKKMRLALALTGLRDVSVGSCEQFQGQERKVIIISTVRSSPDLLQQDARFNLGFVGNRKRFNVAVTRAQALLIVVGNPRVLCGDDNWRELYEHCRDNGACTGDAAWTSPEDVENRAEEIFGGDDGVWADVESDNEDNAGPAYAEDGNADDGAPPAPARPRRANMNCVIS
jgi:superfamily I DNA and/or RNA helicase